MSYTQEALKLLKSYEYMHTVKLSFSLLSSNDPEETLVLKRLYFSFYSADGYLLYMMQTHLSNRAHISRYQVSKLNDWLGIQAVTYAKKEATL